jgi:hypothetical protein
MEQQTRYDVLAGKLKNHRLGAVILAAFVVLIALGSATESIQRLWGVVAPAEVRAPAGTVGAEATTGSAPPKPVVRTVEIPDKSVPSPECRYVFLSPLSENGISIKPNEKAVFSLDSNDVDVTTTAKAGTILTLKHFDHGRYSASLYISERRVSLDFTNHMVDAVPAGMLPVNSYASSRFWGNRSLVLAEVQNYYVEPKSTSESKLSFGDPGSLVARALTDNEARRFATRFRLTVPDCSKAPSGVS